MSDKDSAILATHFPLHVSLHQWIENNKSEWVHKEDERRNGDKNTSYTYYYRYSALGPRPELSQVTGMLHPGQVLRGCLPLLSPAF